MARLLTHLVLSAVTGICANPAVAQVLPVWNAAYQENYEPDSMADITTNARNAYVLLDPFQDDVRGAIAAIKANGNQVAAYISIGTGEDWRADFAALKPSLVTKAWGDWPGEYFISTPDDAVIEVMKARIDAIAAWGFDWVEFDNMDWALDDDYRAAYQFSATAAQSADYYQTLCTYAHSKGIRCMAKSTVQDAEMFDGVTYESYEDNMSWWDQAGAASFVSAGKLVVIVHYDARNCGATLAHYRGIYGAGVSFICEDRKLQRYTSPGR